MDTILILLGWLFVIGFIILGILEIVGTWKRWPYYVSPSGEWGLWYSRSFIKKQFGQKWLIFYNYLVGFLCAFFGLIGLVNGVKDLMSP